MIVLGLDPGTEMSALCAFDGEAISLACTVPNDDVFRVLEKCPEITKRGWLVLEKIESYGMAVGAETFATVFWSGRFAQAWGGTWAQLGRREIKQHLCYSARATDSNIRQALIDRFGPGKDKAIGTKKAQGPLYGVKGHEFAALAVAVTWWDLQSAPKTETPQRTEVGF